MHAGENEAEAGLILSFLENAGIPAELRNMPLAPLRGTKCVAEVWVEEARLADALRVLEEHRRDPGSRPKLLLCRHCGAENPGGFDGCWKCEGMLAGSPQAPAGRAGADEEADDDEEYAAEEDHREDDDREDDDRGEEPGEEPEFPRAWSVAEIVVITGLFLLFFVVLIAAFASWW